VGLADGDASGAGVAGTGAAPRAVTPKITAATATDAIICRLQYDERRNKSALEGSHVPNLAIGIA